MSSNWISRQVVLLTGTAAVLCGILFMALSNAPVRLMLINLVALGVGAALVAIARLLPPLTSVQRGLALLALSTGLIATALLGASSEGASRWIIVAGLSIQPSLILVPVLLLAHAARPDRWSGAAVVVAALAMALQPDRSIAFTIAAVMALDLLRRRSVASGLSFLLCLAALAITVLRPDRLPAVPYVDQVLWTSVTTAPLAAVSIWIGVLLLFLPAALLWRRGERVLASTCAAIWFCLVLSAGLGNYPTPLVGYGASAIIGYVLTSLAIAGTSRHSIRASALSKANDDEQSGQALGFT